MRTPLDEAVISVKSLYRGGDLLVGFSLDPNDVVGGSEEPGYGGAERRANIYPVRTDEEGGELWSRVIDKGTNLLVANGQVTGGGGALVLATVSHFPEPDDDLYLLRTDASGEELWSRTWEDGVASSGSPSWTRSRNRHDCTGGLEEHAPGALGIRIRSGKAWTTTIVEEVMIIRRPIGFGIILVMAMAGCDEPLDVLPRVTGRVVLYDERGNALPAADGIRVSALSASSIRQYEAFTDPSGSFEIELPENEVVPLLFSLEGFGEMFRFDVEEEAEPIEVGMFAISSARVTSATAEAEPCGTLRCLSLALEVENFFGAGTTRRAFRVYMSTDPAVSAFGYRVTDLLVVPNDQPGLVQTGSDATFELDGLSGLLGSFATGAMVHLVIHGATENMDSGYPSPENGLAIFTDISPVSAEASFIVP